MNGDRIKCPSCGYMMRILEVNEKGFLCYCASCKRDIMVRSGNTENNKRFYISSDNNQNIYDTVLKCYYSSIDAQRLCSVLNELYYANEHLKRSVKRQQSSNCECSKLIEEQQKENQRLIKMLDNVANFMQRQNKDMPIDDFVEWWNKIATEGLDD